MDGRVDTGWDASKFEANPEPAPEAPFPLSDFQPDYTLPPAPLAEPPERSLGKIEPKQKFGEAFARARGAGLKVFEWGGKSYSTETREEAAIRVGGKAKPVSDKPAAAPADDGWSLAAFGVQEPGAVDAPGALYSPKTTQERVEAARRAVPVPELTKERGFKAAAKQYMHDVNRAASEEFVSARAEALLREQPYLKPETAKALAVREAMGGGKADIIEDRDMATQRGIEAGRRQEDMGIGDAIMSGTGKLTDAAKITGSYALGTEALAGAISDAMKSGPQDLSATAFGAQLQDVGSSMTLDKSAREKLGGFVDIGNAILSNPKGFTHFISEQAPNFAAMTAGNLIGWVTGGPAGARAGQAVSEFPLEFGSQLQDRVGKSLNGREATRENVLAALNENPNMVRQALTKAIGTTFIDSVTTVAGQKVAADVAAASAVKARRALGNEASASDIASFVVRDLARNPMTMTKAVGKGMAVDTTGAAASEIIPQKVAYGEVDAADVIGETLLEPVFGSVGIAGAAVAAGRQAATTNFDADVMAGLLDNSIRGAEFAPLPDAGIGQDGPGQADYEATMRHAFGGATQPGATTAPDAVSLAPTPVAPPPPSGPVTAALQEAMPTMPPAAAEQPWRNQSFSDLLAQDAADPLVRPENMLPVEDAEPMPEMSAASADQDWAPMPAMPSMPDGQEWTPMPASPEMAEDQPLETNDIEWANQLPVDAAENAEPESGIFSDQSQADAEPQDDWLNRFISEDTGTEEAASDPVFSAAFNDLPDEPNLIAKQEADAPLESSVEPGVMAEAPPDNIATNDTAPAESVVFVSGVDGFDDDELLRLAEAAATNDKGAPDASTEMAAFGREGQSDQPQGSQADRGTGGRSESTARDRYAGGTESSVGTAVSLGDALPGSAALADEAVYPAEEAAIEAQETGGDTQTRSGYSVFSPSIMSISVNHETGGIGGGDTTIINQFEPVEAKREIGDIATQPTTNTEAATTLEAALRGTGNPAIDLAAHAAASSPLNAVPEPTEAQKKAGNYAVGRVRLHGIDISIENPAGSIRSGTDSDGERWETVMQSHYGYIRNSTGRDKDHIDVFLSQGADTARTVWVIDQINQDGTFDEHKIVIGPETEAAARAAYLANYEPGWQGLGAITPMAMDDFKAWVFDKKKTKRPVAYKKSRAGTGMTPHDDPRIAQYADTLRELASQTGWAQTGGRIYRNPDTGEVDGRTAWIPKAEWYSNLSERLSGGDAVSAVEAAISGASMSVRQKRFVSDLLDVAESYANVDTEDHDPDSAAEAAAERAAIQATEDLIVEMDDSDIDALIDAAWNAEPIERRELSDEEINELFGAPSEEAPGTASAEGAVAVGQDEGDNRGSDSDGTAGDAEEVAFSLSGQTPEQAKSEAEAAESAKQAADAEAKKAEEVAKQQRIAAEVASRQQASAENFVLGQDAEDALAGQGDVFSQEAKPAAKVVTEGGKPVATKEPAADDAPFDSEAFDKARNERVKASKAAGNKHLDQVTPSVETMRGKEIYYAHNPQQRGVIRTVDNRGNVYVYWADQYSADRESASESVEDNKSWLKSSKGMPYLRTVRDGKTYVFESSLGTTDLKDYVFAAGARPVEVAQGKEPPASLPSEAAKEGGVTEETLKDLRLLQESRGRWQYKFAVESSWMTANTKADAVERATATYFKTPEAERLTSQQRADKADADEFSQMDQNYKALSLAQLRHKYESLGGEIASNQRAGQMEMDENGGRRTAAAVSNEAARDGGQERMKLARYIAKREAKEVEGASTNPILINGEISKKPTASSNTVFTEDAAEKARALLKSKLGRLNTGIDPEVMQAGITLAGYHIEKGARTFAAYAKAMIEDLGDAVKPYLKSWYAAVKYDPRATSFEMDGMADVEKADIDAILKESDALPDGWTEATPGGMAANNDPVSGGIVDSEIVSGKWFAIPNNDAITKIEGMDTRADAFAALQSAIDKEQRNEPDQRSNTDLERNRQDAGTQDGMGEEGVRADGRRDVGPGEQGIQSAEVKARAGDSQRVSGREAAAAGTQGDFSPFAETHGTGELFTGDQLDLGSSGDSFDGPTIEPAGTAATDRVAQGGFDLTAKRLAQAKAQSVPVIAGDRANISESLPFLLEGQKDDVAFAEARFSRPDGYGVLFTNGTGTGKTASGLGIVKRFERLGKTNTLIVVPSDKIMSDWINFAKNLKLNITGLENTGDAGQGIVITTYANMGANNALVNRKWDLIVADESHYLMQAKDGGSTQALDNLRAITLHPRGQYERHSRMYAKEIADLKALRGRITSNNKIMNLDDTMDQMIRALRDENDKMEVEADKLSAFLREAQEQVKSDVEAAQGASRPRAVFLSATPFAYEKTVDYAEGYLFNYGPEDTRGGYNAGDQFDRFMMQHFGYRMRYNKLNEPGPEVNRGLMQRQFNSWLKSEKVLSGRMLDVEHDYDRKFVLVDSAIGAELDRAMQWIWDRAYDSGNPNKEGYSALQSTLSDKFDHLTRRYLLEAIKAKEAIPIIRAHLNMGRKVVVFHDFKKGGGFNPLRFSMANAEAAQDDSQRTSMQGWNSAIEAFNAEFQGLIESPMWNAASPIDALSSAFPGALLFNGDVPAKKRRENVTLFNNDDSGKNLIIGQSAAMKEGVSLHDTTGKHPRVLINLGLPTQPTTAIQQEGRIFRVGQASNAMFRYLNTGTNWERFAFATSVAQRASAAENLAVGEEARALMDAFIEGFEESDAYPSGHDGEGTGGKLRDKAANQALTEWDRAMTLYWAQQKKTSRTKAQEGVDYFATPEPLGLKMVEWADIRDGDKALEPSAGHGPIARWLPDNISRTVVEPSSELSSRLKMVMMGDGVRLLQEQFEQLDTINKYDAIVMNPPFGSGGKTAVDHVAKAAKHLNNGGRIVALIPTGPAADKKFDKWFYEEEQKAVKPLFEHPTLGPIYKGDKIKRNFGDAEEIVGVRGGMLLVKAPSGGNIERSVAFAESNWIVPGDRRTESFRPAADLYLRADIKLPQATFERAGTRVAARVVVIEKQTDKDAAGQIHAVQRDYSDADDIKGFFERIKDASIPARAAAKVSEVASHTPTPEQTAQAVQGAMSGFKLAQTKHAIKGIDLYVATLDKKVEYDEYKRIEKAAKQHGGYYSNFAKNGAIPGFQFETEADRTAFLGVFRPALTEELAKEGKDGGSSVNQPTGVSGYEHLARLFNALPKEQRQSVAAATGRDWLSDNREEYRRYSILANGIAADFGVAGKADLIGRSVKNSHDLAVLAQLYRDPRFETFRYVFVSGGSIVSTNAVSSRLPGKSETVFGNTEDERNRYVADITAQAKSLGADAVWLLHNHPSGDPVPSEDDVRATDTLERKLAANGVNLAGHVIINHKRYGTINIGKNGIETNVETLPYGTDIQYNLDHQKTAHPMLGQRVLRGAYDLAAIAKQAQVSKGNVVLVGLSGTSGVRVIAEVTPNQLGGPMGAAIIRRISRQTGADFMFAYGVPVELSDKAMKAIGSGLLVDAVLVHNGEEYSLAGHANENRKPDDSLGTKDAGYTVSLPVWHGTPHIWAPEPGFPHGRPRLDKMGTGEGAQAYGWGVYLATVSDVADSYRKNLSDRFSGRLGPSSKMPSAPNKSLSDGAVVQAKELGKLLVSDPFIKQGFGGLDVPGRRMMMSHVIGLLHDDKIFKSVVSDIPVDVMNMLIGGKASTDSVLNNKSMFIDALTANSAQLVSTGSRSATVLGLIAARDAAVNLGGLDVATVAGKLLPAEIANKINFHVVSLPKPYNEVNGSLYQLDIPDDVLPYLLDWDKPLSQQTAEVRKALAKAGVVDFDKNIGPSATGEVRDLGWAKNVGSLRGEEIYKRIVEGNFGKASEVTSSARKASEKAASEYLASIGIVGNRYLDGQSRNRPLKNIKREFLAELPEDADTSEVADLIGTGKFSPKNDALLRALKNNDWLGFDYPAQAVSAVLSKDISGYDASPALIRAVEDAKEGGTYNFVIWDQPTLDRIALLERNGERLDAMREADTSLSRTGQSDDQAGDEEIHPEDFDAVVQRVRSAFPGLQFNAMEDERQAPRELLDFIDANGATGQTEAATHKGEVYLFRRGLRNIKRAEDVAIHEAEHAGLLRLYGEDIWPMMLDINQSNPAVSAQAEKLRKKFNYSVARATWETLADMGSAVRNLNGWDRLVAWVRDRLRRAGLVKQWTDNDVEAMVLRGLAAARRPMRTSIYPPMSISGRDSSLSRNTGDTILVDGKERSLLNSDGKPIAATDEGLRNFWRWFGDSMVVDEQGRPLVAYHGTGKDFAVFNAPMVWMSASHGHASSYAEAAGDLRGGSPTVVPGYVKVLRPFNADIGGDRGYMTIKELVDSAIAQAEKQGHPVSQEDASNYRESLPRIWKQFGLDNSQVDTHHHWSMVGRIGTINLRDSLQNMGFDGISYSENSGFNGDLELTNTFAAFTPAQIKSAIGNAGTFDPTNPNISLSRRGQSPGPVPSLPSPAVANKLKRIGQASKLKNFVIPPETGFRQQQRIFQDSMNRFTVIQDWLAEQGVADLPYGRMDVYRSEERMHGKIASRIEDFREKRLTPLIKRIHKAGFEMDQVAEYLHANHAIERNEQIERINKAAVDVNGDRNGSGMTDAEAAAVLSTYQALPNFSEFEALAEEVRSITDSTKRILLGAGIISQDQADAWDAAYKHYVPLRGNDEGGTASGKGLSVNAKSEHKRAMGHGDRESGEWIVENIIHAHERAIYLAEKNVVGKHLLTLAASVPNADLWTVSKPAKRGVIMPGQVAFAVAYKGNVVASFNTKAEAESFVNQSVMSNTARAKSNYTVNRTVGDPQVVYMASGQLADNEVQVYVKGHAVRIQLIDPLLANAYKRLGQENLTGIMALGRDINNFLSMAYTGLAPEFIVTNVQRDLLSGMVNILGEEGATVAVRSMKNWPEAMYRMFRFSVTGNGDPWFNAYRASGGSTGGAYIGDLDRIGREVQATYDEAIGVFRMFRENRTGKASLLAAKKLLHIFTFWIEHMNAAAEGGMRLAAYRAKIETEAKRLGVTADVLRDEKSLRATVARNRAASLAKNSTVNFNRKGEKGAEINANFLFYNAAVQGSAIMAHALVKGKRKGQAWTALATLTGLAALLASQFGDDEWEEIPQHEKDRNMLIKLGDTGYVAKYSVPYGHGLAFAMGNSLHDLSQGKAAGAVGYHMASSVFENLMPRNPLGENAKSLEDYGWTNFVPEGAFVGVKLWSNIGINRDGFGRQIMPESKYDETQPDHLKMYSTLQGSIYDKITSSTNKAFGGTDTQAGDLDVSPETLQFLFESITGGLGRFAVDEANVAKLAAQGSAPEVKEVPVVRKFARERNRASDARSEFWETLGKAEDYIANRTRAVKGNDSAALERMERGHANLSKKVNEFKDAATAIRDSINQKRNDDTLSAAKKREAIREIETGSVKAFRDMRHRLDDEMDLLKQ